MRGSSSAIAADGSSALMPMTRVDSPWSAQPATRPACVPPDDVDETMTSGAGICCSSSPIASAKAAAPSGVEAPSGITNGRFRLVREAPRPPFHRRRAILAAIDVANVGAEQAIEQRVRRRLRRRRAVGDEDAAEPHPRRHARGGARMIRLDAAGRDQRVGALGDRLRRDEPQLADLVPAEAERNGIVALDEEPAILRLRAALASSREQLLDRRRRERERQASAAIRVAAISPRAAQVTLV